MKRTMPLRNSQCFSRVEFESVSRILREYWQESVDVERVGDFTKALELHEQILAEVVCSYEMCLRAGWLHYQAGGFQQSIYFYDEASRCCPEAIAPLFGAMGCYVAMGDLYHATLLVKAIVELDEVKPYASPRDAVMDATREFHVTPDFMHPSADRFDSYVQLEEVGAA